MAMKQMIERNERGGDNCCMPLCHTTSRKDKGVSLFKPTNLNGEYYTKWNSEIYQVILRYRVNNAEFKNMREKRKIYVCEKHYAKDDIELTKTGRKTVKLGALPTLNLPSKSHEVLEKSRKPTTERGKSDGDYTSTTQQSYKNFGELSKSVPKMKLNEWTEMILLNTTTKHNSTTSFQIIILYKSQR